MLAGTLEDKSAPSPVPVAEWQEMGREETHLDVSLRHASSKVGGSAATYFMHLRNGAKIRENSLELTETYGGKRAPILISTSDDGPIYK